MKHHLLTAGDVIDRLSIFDRDLPVFAEDLVRLGVKSVIEEIRDRLNDASAEIKLDGACYRLFTADGPTDWVGLTSYDVAKFVMADTEPT